MPCENEELFLDMVPDGVASAIGLSPDGSMLYVAAGGQGLYSYYTSSNASYASNWFASLPDADLCDLAVSADGLSVSPSEREFLEHSRNQQNCFATLIEEVYTHRFIIRPHVSRWI